MKFITKIEDKDLYNIIEYNVRRYEILPKSILNKIISFYSK